MSFKSSYVLLTLCFVWQAIGWSRVSLGLQNNAVPSTTAPINPNANPAGGTLLETYRDRNGQPYGRYIVTEPVPIAEWEYKQVSERLYVPVPVTEPRTTSVPRHIPVVTQQLQLQNVPGLNPFAPPQQVWRYVPVVHYQTVYEQETKPFTFQKYEEKEVSKMVPVLTTKTKQVNKIVDRALGPLPNGNGSSVDGYSNANPGIAIPSNALAGNLYQQNAQLAEANRNQSRFPTRPIGPYYGYNPGLNLLSQTPAPYYPNYARPNTNPATNNPVNSMVASAQPQIPNSNLVMPAIPLRAEPNNMVAYNGYPPNPYSSNPSSPAGVGPGYPYTSVASRPLFNWPSFASGTGSLFERGLFSNNRNTSYVASNTPVTQPYVWGNSAGMNNSFNSFNGGSASGMGSSGFGFRPISNAYATPQQSWGMVPGNTYRDPMQGGMPATVLR